nr:hypothetical protein [uncultured Massilia sp.]
MSTFSQKLNLANFTCTFGDKFLLLDMFDQVVLPAFQGKLTRTYGNASYFLHGVKLIKYGDEELVIAGRLIKDTTVERDQFIDAGSLVKDRQVLKSSPSSFFALILSNHKLLYVRENVGAPPISAFEATIAKFLNDCYKVWLRSIYDTTNENGRKVTWSQLYALYPPPNLDVLPMGTEESVAAYVEKFRTINLVEVKLSETNHELDNNKLFADIRKVKENVGASNVALRSQKSGDVGLDKGGITKLIAEQAEGGNARITIRGKSLAGDKMTAQNESFNIALPIQTVPEETIPATTLVRAALTAQVKQGFIRVAKAPAAAITKIKRLIEERSWS